MTPPGPYVRWRARWEAQGGNVASYGGTLVPDAQLSASDAYGLALALYQTHSAGQYPVNVWVSELWTLQEVRVLALGQAAIAASAGASTISGTVAGDALPPSCAFGILHTAETTWKGGHPMWRIPGVAQSQVQVGATARLDQAVIEGLGLAATNLLLAPETPGFAGPINYFPAVLLQGRKDQPVPPGPTLERLVVSRCQPTLSTVRKRNRS